MIHTIAAKWSEIETDLTLRGVEKRQVEAYRKVFYTGAFGALAVIAENGTGAPTVYGLCGTMEAIREEIKTALRETFE